MTIQQTQMEIINQSIDVIGATPITDIGEDSSTADKYTRAYDFVLRGILSEYPWNFATKKIDVEATEVDEKFYYIVPEDCLKIWKVNGNTDFEQFTIEINGTNTNVLTSCYGSGALLNDDGDNNLCLEYIFYNNDTTMFSAHFTEYFIYALAARLALTFRESSTAVQLLESQKLDKGRISKHADAMESGQHKYTVAGNDFPYLNLSRNRYWSRGR